MELIKNKHEDCISTEFWFSGIHDDNKAILQENTCAYMNYIHGIEYWINTYFMDI